MPARSYEELSSQEQTFACIEFLLLHEAILKAKGGIQRLSDQIFGNARDSRLSKAKLEAELFLKDKVKHALKIKYNGLILPELSERIKKEVDFKSGVDGLTLDKLFEKIKGYIIGIKEQISSWSDLRGKIRDNCKLGSTWQGIEVSEWKTHTGEYHDQVCYVAAIYAGEGMEFESRYKGVFTIYPGSNRVHFKYFENSQDTRNPTFEESNKIVQQGTVVQFLCQKKNSIRLYSIQQGESSWKNPPAYLRSRLKTPTG